MNRLTKIFQPTLIVPKNAVVKNQDVTSKSQRLMLEQGLIRQAGNGTFYLMPLLQRSLQKAVDLVDHFMQRHASAQKLTLPILTAASLWRQSGRLESAGPELMRTTDRHGKQQILGPTHEESITALVASISPVSYRAFPLRLYQISTKFRDEMKPRFGLMRAKEFLMKDLYTFDVGRGEARETYEEVNEAYRKLFDAVGVGYVKVRGDTGTIGGSESHEYHFPSEVGEDQLVPRGPTYRASQIRPSLDVSCPPNSVHSPAGPGSMVAVVKKNRPEVAQIKMAATGKLSLLTRQLSTSSAAAQLVKPPIQVFGLEGRYACALYSAASKTKSLEAVEKDLKSLQSQMRADPKVRDLLINPTIKRNLKAAAMKDLASKVKFNAATGNLLGLLAENGRLGRLDGITNAFSLIMAADRGEVVCEVKTAKPLDDSQRKQLEGALKAFLKPNQTIQLTAKVDPSLIGGMIVSIGDKYVDMSVASKIKKYTDIIAVPV
ncbi:prolyl-tRNA synthetase [Culex quinquefasciatus]|uniref:Oligomycin sensitivity conferral protein n=2 Tax=Culex quinquefasciatus TaxID=7176 RepID=B0XIT5_CULQU|nr:prolyl-tRNA synthetase [Culex quinquefasciatus]|eukprot:XP_001869557.1 prolyl-tRNA synthetase [Culex quinquefasciatus]